MQEPIIKIENLSCRYGNHYVLRNIDWEVSAGEHWLVFGLNGSGKTTLMTILAGYGYHNEGTLSVFGSSYTENNVLEKRKRIGLISSSFFDRIYRHETVLDIIYSGLNGTLSCPFLIPDSERKKALALLDILGISDKKSMPYSKLSKGQRQNVLIARALINNPDILILDEPVTGLDVFNRELLLANINDLALNTNMTMLYVTHYPEEILETFDHCLLLKNGYTYCKDQTNNVFKSDTFSKFLDYPVHVGTDSSRLHISLTTPTEIRALLNQ